MSMNVKHIEIREFTSARDFVDALRVSNPEWTDNGSWASDWYFRGQRSVQYDLKPTAHRDVAILPSDIKELERLNLAYVSGVVDQLCKKSDSWQTMLTGGGANRAAHDLTAQGLAYRQIVENRDNLVLALTRSKSENDIAYKYATELDAVGLLEFPPNINFASELDDAKRYARHIFECFSADVIGEPNFWLGDVSILRKYFWLAQHHSLSTRLLDWSENSLAAAYFSVESIKDDQEDDLCVWAFNNEIYRKYWAQGPNNWVCFSTPPHGGSDYMRAQKGSFAYFPHAERYYLEHSDWPCIDSVVSNYPGIVKGVPICLKKLCMPVSQAAELARLLKLEGISRSTLMPAHDQVAASIKTEFRFLQ